MTLIEALKVNGKARRSQYVDGVFVWRTSDGFSIIDHAGRKIYDLNHILADDWEPFKKPCKHEPVGLIGINGKQKAGFFGSENVLIFSQQNIENAYHCKHCGVKIKATGWEEA